MPGYYQLKPAAGGKFVFNLKAGNHEVILTSELYESSAAAKDGIESVRKNGIDAASFEKKVSVKEEPFFVLKAPNGKTIGRSEMYSSDTARNKGIESVIRNAPSERVMEVPA